MSEAELVPTAQLVLKALSAPKATVSKVLQAAKPEAAKIELAQTPLPKSPALDEDAWDAVETARDLLGNLKLPDRRRMLTEDELERVTRTYAAVQTALSGLNRSRDQIKATAFNHFDAIAVHDGKVTAETSFTKEGWAVVEDKTSGVIDGLPVKITREVSGGKTELTVEGLRALVEDEKIDQADLLAMTRQTRVLDEARALEWIRKNPERAALLVEATSTASATAGFWLRKND